MNFGFIPRAADERYETKSLSRAEKIVFESRRCGSGSVNYGGHVVYEAPVR